jgi:hypothetical protein
LQECIWLCDDRGIDSYEVHNLEAKCQCRLRKE